MHPAIAPLAAIYDLNTDLLINCLDGVDEEAARRRLASGGNSLTFIAAHLTDSRHFIASRLGTPLHNPLTPYLADARTIDEIATLPSLDLVRSAWIAVAEHLAGVLDGLDEAALARQQIHRFPVADSSVVGFLTFLAQHDSYHVGQAAFLRRQLGLAAMTYARGTRRQDPTPAA